MGSESPAKNSLLDPTCRVSDSVGMGKNPRVCVSNHFASDANAAGQETTLGEKLN